MQSYTLSGFRHPSSDDVPFTKPPILSPAHVSAVEPMLGALLLPHSLEKVGGDTSQEALLYDRQCHIAHWWPSESQVD